MAVTSAAVVRYGQMFYVLVNAATAQSREAVEREAVARYPFTGAARRSNPSAAEAYAAARAMCRTLVGNEED
jgi:hypothetical protein